MTSIENATIDARRLLITVHGIRTFGRWQERLERELQEHGGVEAEVCHYRYGYFTILAFLIPPLRLIATKKFRSELLKQTRRHSWTRVDIVAHSFGTHLVAWALLGLTPTERPKIQTLILSGSVLRSSFPVSEIVPSCVTRLVNDCGIKDVVLLINQVFVLFTGMAGRVGITGMEGRTFRNRYFDFGHSGYFKESQSSPDFMSQYWVPLLASETGIPPHDIRKPSPFDDLTTMFLNNAEPIKLLLYVLPLILIIVGVNGLRLSANQRALLIEQQNIRQEGELAGTLAHGQPLLATSAIFSAADQSYDLSRKLVPEIEGALFNILQSAREQTHIPLGGEMSVLQIRRSGKTTFAGDGAIIRAWDEDGHMLYELGNFDASRVSSLSFSPAAQDLVAFDVNRAGSLLAAVTSDGTVHTYAALSGVESASWPTGDKTVSSISLSLDGASVTTLSADNITRVWGSTGKQKLVRHWDPTKAIVLSTFINDQQFLTLTKEGQLTISTIGAPEKQYDVGIKSAEHAVLNETRTHLAIQSGDRIAVWELGSQTLVQSIQPTGTVLSFALHPNGITVATASLDGVIRLWGVDGIPTISFQTTPAGIKSLAFDASGEVLFGAGSSIYSWSLARLPTNFDSRRKISALAVAASPQGDVTALVDAEGELQIFNRLGKTLAKFHATEEFDKVGVTALAWSPDGTTIALGQTNGHVSLLKIEPGRITRQAYFTDVGGVANICFTATNQIVTAGSSDSIRLWTKDGKAAGTLKSSHQTGVIGLVTLHSPERSVMTRVETLQVWSRKRQELGERLVTAGLDGYVEVWDLASLKSLFRFRNAPGHITALTRSPDSATLLIGGDNGIVRRWKTVSGELVWTSPVFAGTIAGINEFDSGLILVAGREGDIRFLGGDGKPVSDIFRSLRVISAVSSSPRSGPIVFLSDNGKRLTLLPGTGDAWLESLCSRTQRHVDLRSDRSVCQMTPSRTLLDLVLDGSASSIARATVGKRSDIEIRNQNGMTPLMLASSLGYSDAVNLLLASSANPKVTDNLGNTPLHLAARINDVESMRALIRAGLAPDSLGIANSTPLFDAIEGHSDAAIDLLLGAGADPRHVDKSGKTPWKLALSLDEGHAMNSLIEVQAATLQDLPPKYRKPDNRLVSLPLDLPPPKNRWTALGISLQQKSTQALSLKQAATAYQRGVNEGDSMAMYLLGRLVESGMERSIDPLNARSLYAHAAELGDPLGLNGLGVGFDNGSLAAPDAPRAVSYYRKATGAGNSHAMRNLALALKANPELALNGETVAGLMLKSATAGYVDAQWRVAMMYEDGDTLHQSYPDAAFWYRRAATQDNANSKYRLSALISLGLASPTYRGEGISLLRRAAEGGDAEAEFHLGWALLNGVQLEKSTSDGLRWLEKATNVGQRDAVLYLAQCYEGAYGVPRNLVEAVRLYRRSACGGSESARESLARLGYEETLCGQ